MMLEAQHIVFMLAYSVWGLAFANNLYGHLNVEDYDESGEGTVSVNVTGFFLILISVVAYAHS